MHASIVVCIYTYVYVDMQITILYIHRITYDPCWTKSVSSSYGYSGHIQLMYTCLKVHACFHDDVCEQIANTQRCHELLIQNIVMKA